MCEVARLPVEKPIRMESWGSSSIPPSYSDPPLEAIPTCGFAQRAHTLPVFSEDTIIVRGWPAFRPTPAEPSTAIYIFQDGASFAAVGPGFVNLQESASAWADTAEEAAEKFFAAMGATS